jgi:hypothetical protein
VEEETPPVFFHACEIEGRLSHEKGFFSQVFAVLLFLASQS